MMNPDAAIHDNVHYLRQASALLEKITSQQFTHTNPPLYRNGIGPHLRHSLDHMELFVNGWRKGIVDYDQRPRRDRQQRDPAAMRSWIEELCKDLEKLRSEDLTRPLKVKMDCGSEMPDPWSGSTVLRELQFLISHTVHHFALMAMMLHDQGLKVPEGFGVAPSTLKFEAENAACAP